MLNVVNALNNFETLLFNTFLTCQPKKITRNIGMARTNRGIIYALPNSDIGGQISPIIIAMNECRIISFILVFLLFFCIYPPFKLLA